MFYRHSIANTTTTLTFTYCSRMHDYPTPNPLISQWCSIKRGEVVTFPIQSSVNPFIRTWLSFHNDIVFHPNPIWNNGNMCQVKKTKSIYILNVKNCRTVQRIMVFTWSLLLVICWHGVTGESNDALRMCMYDANFVIPGRFKITGQENKGWHTISPWQENPRDRLSLTGTAQLNDNAYLVGSEWVVYIMARRASETSFH